MEIFNTIVKRDRENQNF